MNKMNSAILKKATGTKNSYIRMKIDPFDLTYNEETKLEEFSGIGLGLYVGLGVAFVPALICAFLVMEIETNIKHQ
jgi:hypothetical protein